jgi:tol-pal system protein YbgF
MRLGTFFLFAAGLSRPAAGRASGVRTASRDAGRVAASARARRFGAPLVASVALVAATAAPAAAANKEHQQMMAEIRMLQEQNLQLQQSIGTLVDALKTVTTKIDDQSAATRKVAADQRLLIEGLSGELRIVREKIDDTGVRLGSLAQEVDSLRNSIPPAAAPMTSTDPSAVPPGSTSAPTTTPTPGGTPPLSAPVAATPAPNPGAGMSPARLWDMAFSDYAAGQWALAIQGFDTYLRAFPRSDKSDDAQFFIGEAYQLDGKMREAIAAYDRVIADYPQGDRTAAAYYKRGVVYSSLNQPDKARESFEAVVKLFPNTESAGLARQRLNDQGRRDE